MRQKNLAGKCTHEDSRLSCMECNQPICANCMIQCPVGFRCKTCVGSVKNPSGSTSPLSVPKTLGMVTAVGCAGGWVMPFISVPYLSCFICFFLGLFAGRWLATVIDYKLGAKVGTIVVFGILIGLSLSPVNLVVMVTVDLISEIFRGNTNVLDALNAIANMIFCPVCFIVGVLRSTVWGERF